MFRSYLFVPAHESDKLQQALSSSADALIVDLEDTVPPEHKEKGRATAVELMAAQPEKPVSVRINSATSEFVYDDLTVLIEGAAEAVTDVWLPKSESATEVAHVSWLLHQLERRRNLRQGQVRLSPLIETAQGVLDAPEVAKASSRVRRLSFGIADLSSDMGLGWPADGSEQLHVRSVIAFASRAAGLEPPVDSVWPDVSDVKGLMNDCRAARALGYVGKLAVDPDQTKAINDSFSPSQEEVRRAEEVLSAVETARREGRAAATLADGSFVDPAFLGRARAVLELAQRAGPPTSSET